MQAVASIRWLAIAAALAASPQPVQSQSAGQPAPAEGAWGATVSTPRTAAPIRGGRVARSVELTGDAQRTRLSFELSASVPFSAFRLTRPYRVVIDLAEIEFNLPAGSGAKGRGLVQAYRYGLFAPGKARIVIDTVGPARIEAAHMVQVPGAATARLEVDLVPTTAADFAATEIANAAQTIDVAPVKPNEPAAAKSPKERTRPVVVIDPGHGGIDPGAQGSLGFEKDVVLAVAREIRQGLLASRRYEVVMTRSSDVFVSLDQRVTLSRRHNADLFLSIYADLLAQKDLAQAIRGATVYTLAEKATDDRARAMAEKENASDLLAGIDVSGIASDDQVRNILVDLMRRESSNFSNNFRSLLVNQLRPRLALAKDPLRGAPFKVLRQPGSPAVLVELGYMSNAEDEKLMSSPGWQRGVGEAVVGAVEAYFRGRQSKAN